MGERENRTSSVGWMHDTCLDGVAACETDGCSATPAEAEGGSGSWHQVRCE